MSPARSRHKNVYHVNKMISDDSETLIVIDTEDTDVVAIAAASSHNLDVPTFLYRNGKFFNCSMLCTDDVAPIIIQRVDRLGF